MVSASAIGTGPKTAADYAKLDEEHRLKMTAPKDKYLGWPKGLDLGDLDEECK